MAHHRFSDEEVDFFRKELLSFYEANKRDLPWRNLANTLEDVNQRAYSVWVSEIMLQQTQVNTVIDYYNRWIKRWPTIAHLAKATLEQVNEMWSGLGYYSRGRKLYEGAKLLRERSETDCVEMPKTAKDLMRDISGVGSYTAGAIASIAYQQVAGVVDGNVIRILSRLRMIGADMSARKTHELFWELAELIVDRDKPGDFNQAMMDLGATICTPKSPQCSKCPLTRICKSYYKVSSFQQNSIEDSFSKKKGNNNAVIIDNSEGEDSSSICDFNLTDIEDVTGCAHCLPPDEPWDRDLGVANFPRKAKKKSSPVEKFISVIIEHNKKYLFVQRADKGLLAGMWEFPMTPMDFQHFDEELEMNIARSDIKRRFGLHQLGKFEFHGEVPHVFSHRHHIYRVYHTTVEDVPSTGVVESEGRSTMWLTQQEAGKAAITTGIKKIMQLKDNISLKNSSKRKRGTAVMSVKGQRTLKEMFSKKTKVPSDD